MRKISIIFFVFMLLLSSCRAMPEGFSAALNNLDSRTKPAELENQQAEAEFERLFNVLMQFLPQEGGVREDALSKKYLWKERAEEELPWSCRKGSYEYFQAMTAATRERNKKMADLIERQQSYTRQLAEKNRLRAAEERWRAAEEEQQRKVADDVEFMQRNTEQAIALVKKSYYPEFTAADRYPSIGEAFESFFDKPKWSAKVAVNGRCYVIFKGVAVSRLSENNVMVTVVFSVKPDSLKNNSDECDVISYTINEKDASISDLFATVYLN